MKFHDELKAHSPFFMRELAIKIIKPSDFISIGKEKKLSEKEALDKVYKKIYMQVRIYHKLEWECKEEKNGKAGRSPLRCIYVGVKK